MVVDSFISWKNEDRSIVTQTQIWETVGKIYKSYKLMMLKSYKHFFKCCKPVAAS